MNRPKDPMHSLINKVLGNYDEVKPLVSHPSIIGVINQPNTPVRTKPEGSLFPQPARPDPKDKEKEREREKEKEKYQAQKNREKDHRPGSSGGRHSASQQQNGEIQKQNKSKDPRDRDNVFEKFNSDNGGQGGYRKSRKDSRSGERHKERSRERSGRSVSSEPDGAGARHKSHHEHDKRAAGRDKERMSRERDTSRGEHPNGSESKSSQEMREVHGASKSSSNVNMDQKGAGKGDQANNSNNKPASSSSGPTKPSHSNSRSPRRSVERQDSSESSGRSEAGHKAPGKGSSLSGAQNEKSSDRNFVKPMNVAVNGVMKRKENAGDGATKHKMAKLKMPNEVGVWNAINKSVSLKRAPN